MVRRRCATTTSFEQRTAHPPTPSRRVPLAGARRRRRNQEEGVKCRQLLADAVQAGLPLRAGIQSSSKRFDPAMRARNAASSSSYVLGKSSEVRRARQAS